MTRSSRPLTIVATDSGLGGLGVVAELAPRLRAARGLGRVRVVYFNCRPDLETGFNRMTPLRQARVFDRALRSMHQRHRPAAILIACHTLSAVYPATAFARRPAAPVHGLVGLSADLIAERLRRVPDAGAILLATPTTHRSGVYAAALARRGIDAGRLMSIDAGSLAGAIERGGDTAEAQALIDDAARRAAAQCLEPERPHVLCLLCTHYPYVGECIRRAFEAHGLHISEMLDPSAQMASDFVASLPSPVDGPQTHIELCVESQVFNEPSSKAAIAALLAARCPDTADALRNETHQPDLFAID